MAKVYIQEAPVVLSTTASLAGSGSTSGSALSKGYSRIVGGVWMSSSTAAASGIRVYESFDGGANWNYTVNASAATNTGVVLTACLHGDAVKIGLVNGATDSASVRAHFHLMPI